MSAYLTTTEVSEILGCHRATLQRWRKEGRGPEHIRPVNGRYLYPRGTFNSWLTENNVTTLKAGA